ncbi:uncharacterized protein [Antedon mediterranea]
MLSQFVQAVLLLILSVHLSSSQNMCDKNKTNYNAEWDREWCLKRGCYYDHHYKQCMKCSPCTYKGYVSNPDGPILQCQIEAENDLLCAYTQKQLTELKNEIRLPLLGIFSSVIAAVVTLTILCIYKCLNKNKDWLRKIQRTERYLRDGEFCISDVPLIYKEVSRKIQELADKLQRNLHTTGDASVTFSKEEIAYRFLVQLCYEKIQIKPIVDNLCKLGYHRLMYELMSGTINTYDIPEMQPSLNPNIDAEMIQDLSRNLHGHPNYPKRQFIVAINLGLTLAEIDNCRSTPTGTNSVDAMDNIFDKWREKYSSNYTYSHLRRALQTAEVAYLLPSPSAQV